MEEYRAQKICEEIPTVCVFTFFDIASTGKKGIGCKFQFLRDSFFILEQHMKWFALHAWAKKSEKRDKLICMKSNFFYTGLTPE